MAHTYGYARVSTKVQSYEEQVKDLEQAGCERIFKDKATGKNTDRPGFQELKTVLLKGDTVIITKLDRVGRNVKDLIGIVNEFKEKGIGFKVLNNAAIDTTTPGGEMIFTVFAAVAQYELELIRERTERGRLAAREQGRTGGRKRTIPQSKVDAVKTLIDNGRSTQDACKEVGISRAAFYRLKDTDNKRK
ncbi:MAG: DNA invertase Pin-like site-specific DNA recombinase [Desulforhopalus sp.]|jgi:DNA invertase Pin-like site-specific DNA recombinase